MSMSQVPGACLPQAVSFLVIHQKHNKSLEEITSDLCPVLSVQQLYRISTMYWDDRYGTETVSHEVLARMKQLMVENNSAASHSFLLDDDSSIPFSLDDIQNLMDDKVRPHGCVCHTASAADGLAFCQRGHHRALCACRRCTARCLCPRG